MQIFNQSQRKKSEYIINHDFSKFSTLHSKEIKDLAILWTYYSGKIEGNSYTYIETDTLIKQGLTSVSGIATYEDAKMLKNLYNTFIYCSKEIKEKGKIELTDTQILSLHSSLTSELIEHSESGKLRDRAVRITGSDYTPPNNKIIIINNFESFLYESSKIQNPLEKAIYLHCNIARLQPFIDGNKRISRLIESITLMNNDIIPIYSNKNEDIENYKSSLLNFYETENYDSYINYFLNKKIKEIEIYTNSEKEYEKEEQKIIKKLNNKKLI